MSEVGNMTGASTPSANEQRALIDRFREMFQFSYDGEQPQRQREEEDLKFQVPEMQWDPDAAAARKGSKEGGVVVFPRPMLSISKLDQPIRLVMKQARDAKLGVNIHPVSENATDDTAAMLQDQYRRIERDSNASVPRLWALDRAVKAGRGTYRICVKPDPNGFDYGDLEIYLERILHQGCVYYDPSAQMPDYRDGEFAYVTTWMPLDKIARLYPGSRAAAAKAGGTLFSGMAGEAPLWVRTEGAIRSNQVAECFYKEHKEEKLLILDKGRPVRDGVDKIPAGRKVVAERIRDNVEVWQSVTNGFDILEKPTLWLGKYIPLVPVLGRELQTFDEQRRVEGMIRGARDPQRFFNTAASTLVERMFMEPRTPWVMAEGQDEGRENEWAQANYRNIPVLRYKPTTLSDGAQAPPPQRVQLDQTGMSIALMALQEAATLCQDATAFFDPSLGKGQHGQESGRHAMALQSQGDAANGDWLENLAVAMRYEAEVIIDLIPAVYDAPGRVTTIISGEDAKAKKVMVNRHFVTDEQTGLPKAAKPNTPGAKIYDLKSGARYGVLIDIGTSFKTRLQEGDEAITRIVEADPSLVGIIGDVLFRFKDFPGAKEIADRLLLLVQAQHPELFKKDEGGPEQLAAKAQAMQQQVAQLSQQLQQAVQALQTDQAKHQAQIEIEKFKAQAMQTIEQAKLQAQVQIADMNNAAKIEVARLTTQTQTLNAQAAAKEELLATGLKIQAEADKTLVAQDHERRMQHQDHAHDVGMAAGNAAGVSRTVEKGHETGQEQAQEHNTAPAEPAAGGGQ